MAYEEKIERVRALVEQHNSQVIEGDRISADVIIGKIRGIGGTSESLLRECSFEDLEACGLPKLLARQAARIFRDSDKAPAAPADGRPAITMKKAAAMSARELVEHYDPRDADNPVGRRLRELSRVKKFLVFVDGRVDVESSIKLLEEIMDGHDDREFVPVAGVPQRTYAVGVRPNQMVDTNPLYPNRTLRPDGTCDQTNRSWDGVPHEVRVLLYLAVRNGELKITRLDDAHEALDRIVGNTDALGTLRLRYARASLEMDELAAAGSLPSLKVARGGIGSERPNNPFGAGSHQWF